MKQENPHDHYEERGSFEPQEVSLEKEAEARENDILERIHEEKRSLTEEDREKIENIRHQIKYEKSVVRDIEDINAKRPHGDETELWANSSSLHVDKKGLFKKVRNALVGLFAFGTIHSSAEAKTPESVQDRDIATATRTIESRDSTKRDTDSTGKIALYTKAKTKEGGVTPTGMSNSFLENKYGVTAEDINTVAARYGFRTENEAVFQEDMVEYAQKNDPKIIEAVLNEFGPTEYAERNNITGYKGLIDKILGARGALMISLYKEKMAENKKEQDPFAAFAKRGTAIYTPGAGGRLIGELCYPTRETTNITDPGTKNTAYEEGVIREMDDFGPTGRVARLTKDEIIELLGGTQNLKNENALALLKEKLNTTTATNR